MQAARSNSLCSTPLVCRSTVRPKSWLTSNGSYTTRHALLSGTISPAILKTLWNFRRRVVWFTFQYVDYGYHSDHCTLHPVWLIKPGAAAYANRCKELWDECKLARARHSAAQPAATLLTLPLLVLFCPRRHEGQPQQELVSAVPGPSCWPMSHSSTEHP